MLEESEAVKPGWGETIAESLFDNNLQRCVKANLMPFI